MVSPSIPKVADFQGVLAESSQPSKKNIVASLFLAQDLTAGRRSLSVPPEASMISAAISPRGVKVDVLSAAYLMNDSSLSNVLSMAQNQNATLIVGKVTSPSRHP
ncbi:hypothetical protein Nepgr_026073 [Nepenthes gracilis]|uniref:Uncharacterized protein n=1 Tax=Nepenthes gracilis TaxID=150966 RepID=A0AAD3T698_NEPGR|nr:hypothetical protein Nepgr_026073 [Nepenthes gracilis]